MTALLRGGRHRSAVFCLISFLTPGRRAELFGFTSTVVKATA
jgi:hypothetical protein